MIFVDLTVFVFFLLCCASSSVSERSTSPTMKSLCAEMEIWL